MVNWTVFGRFRRCFRSNCKEACGSSSVCLPLFPLVETHAPTRIHQAAVRQLPSPQRSVEHRRPGKQLLRTPMDSSFRWPNFGRMAAPQIVLVLEGTHHYRLLLNKS